MSNRSIKESINKITKISSKLDSNLSNLIFSNTAKVDEKNSKKMEFEDNLTSSNNSLNKQYLKENFESNFDKYMINDNHTENCNDFNTNKKIEILDLSASSLIRQSVIDKKGPKQNITQAISNINNLYINDVKNSFSSNSVISSKSSKKSQKFEKNMEKIKNISNNLNNDNNFLKNLMDKIDDNLNSDNIENQFNHNNNTSQKMSNFEMLEKQKIIKINKQVDKIIEHNIIKIETNEELNNTVHSHISKTKNNPPENNKVDNVNNLINNLTSNNASIYHSFGDTNQLIPSFKILYNKETNDEIPELIENNTIELVESLKNSMTSLMGESINRNLLILFNKIEKASELYKKRFIKNFINQINNMVKGLRSREKVYHLKNFFNKINFEIELKINKNLRQERRKMVINIQEIKEFDLKKKLFNEMIRVCINQKQWVSKIRYEFSKNFIWY